MQGLVLDESTVSLAGRSECSDGGLLGDRDRRLAEEGTEDLLALLRLGNSGIRFG